MTYTLVIQLVIALNANTHLTTQAYIPDLPTIESCEYIASLIRANHICIPAEIIESKPLKRANI
jgi:protocatechuate 3,4-dioxygenase beta subunit